MTFLSASYYFLAASDFRRQMTSASSGLMPRSRGWACGWQNKKWEFWSLLCHQLRGLGLALVPFWAQHAHPKPGNKGLEKSLSSGMTLYWSQPWLCPKISWNKPQQVSKPPSELPLSSPFPPQEDNNTCSQGSLKIKWEMELWCLAHHVKFSLFWHCVIAIFKVQALELKDQSFPPPRFNFRNVWLPKKPPKFWSQTVLEEVFWTLGELPWPWTCCPALQMSSYSLVLWAFASKT